MNPSTKTMTMCKAGVIINSLPKKYQKSVNASLKSKFITSSYEITKAMNESGFDIGERTIDRHRTERCVCYK